MKSLGVWGVFGVGLALSLCMGACASAEEDVDSVPIVETDTAEEQLQTITNNGWVITANNPYVHESNLFGVTATTTRLSGASTRAWGACGVKLVKSGGNYVTCSTDATCPNPPSGGSKYCTVIANGTQKYCAYRPGLPSKWCVGTPATGELAAPNTLTKTVTNVSIGDYMNIACLDGCANFAPVVSSAAKVVTGCLMCGSVCC